MQRVQYVLLFLVLGVNSARFRILRGYTLLLKPLIFIHSWSSPSVQSPGFTPAHGQLPTVVIIDKAHISSFTDFQV